MRNKYLILVIILSIMVFSLNLYHKYQQFEIGYEATDTGSFVVAVAMLEPIAKDGYVAAQELLELIYSHGSETVPRDYAKALYWCVQANKPFLADIFGYDIEAINKSCAINFAKEELSYSLNANTLNEYYKSKLIVGINWLKVAFETGDKSTRQLFKKCNLNIIDVKAPTNQWNVDKFKCICDNFDWGERNRPDCTIGKHVDKIESK